MEVELETLAYAQADKADAAFAAKNYVSFIQVLGAGSRAPG